MIALVYALLLSLLELYVYHTGHVSDVACSLFGTVRF